MTTRWAVTVNVGGSFAAQAVQTGMVGWAVSALRREPIFVFAQEVPSPEWLTVWTDAGYSCVLGPDRGWRVRSALLISPEQVIEPLTPPAETSADPWLNTLGYHGSYVAAARWASARGDVLLASVHASPTEADPDRYGWTGAPVTPRSGGGDPRYPGGRLWDSDLLLETLRALSTIGPLLAAGDLNEAVGFDISPDGARLGTWGTEYFARITAAGLTPWLATQWDTELPTHGRLQLDHVVVSWDAEGLLGRSPEPHRDGTWLNATGPVALGDHIPIWFAVDDRWIPPGPPSP